MAGDINRVVLVGRLTRDPEVRHLPSGTPVLQMGIAVNGRQKDDMGTWVDKPNFFDVKLFGPRAESRASPREGQAARHRRPARLVVLGSPGRFEALEGRGRRVRHPVPRQPRRGRVPEHRRTTAVRQDRWRRRRQPDTSDFGPKTGADDDIPF